MVEKSFQLLGPGDPEPVEVVNPKGASRFVLTCEHSGRAVPASLGDLGVEPMELARHIGWDIGAGLVARRLAEGLDAVLIMQRYSRLVVDCNRPPEARDLMPELSDTTRIPANVALTFEERQARLDEIFEPYHRAIESVLDERSLYEPGPILFSVHSFTPTLRGDPTPRPMDFGLLFNKDDRLARGVAEALDKVKSPYVAAFNKPYFIGGGTDYTIPFHGEARCLPHLLIEIRNDHIKTPDTALAMGDFLAEVLLNVDTDFDALQTKAP